MKKLTPKQRAFIAEYLKDKNGTQAAIRAGYAANSANEQAARMLAKDSIRSEVERRLQKVEEKALVSAEYVLSSIKRVADLCQQEIPVIRGEKEVKRDSGEVVFECVDSTGANKSLELLGKHLALFTEKHEIKGSINLVEAVKNSRSNRGLNT